MQLSRIRLAYALAPAMPSCLYAALLVFENSSREIPSILFFSLPVSYAACLLLGLPLVPALRRLRCLNLVCVALGGAGLGILVWFGVLGALAPWLGSHFGELAGSSDLAWGAVFGLSVALPFGLIAGYPLTATARD